MKIEIKKTVDIINCVDEKGTPYYPVSNIAKDLGDNTGCESHDGPIAALNNSLVKHLLHLQDLHCIENLKGKTDWGYQPMGCNVTVSKIEEIRNMIEGDNWDTPHQYLGGQSDSVVRITASGFALRDMLLSDDIPDEKKNKYLIEALDMPLK